MKQITKQYKLLYFLLILLSLTSALLMTFFSLQLGRILDSISNSNSGLLFHITICVSSILLWFLISCSYSYLKNQYVKKVILDLKRRLLLHYLSREFNQIDNRNHSDFLNNITKNSDLIQENLLIPKISLIANLGSLIMSVVAIIYIEWRLALVFLLLSSITIFLSQIPGKLMTKSTNNYSLQNNHYLSKMTNFINGFEQIKLLNIQSWTQEKIQEISLEFEESRKTYQFFLNKSLSQSNQTISEGEKQRIDLARFLAKPYSVYIFDEPTSNLDPIKAKAMMDYILSIKDAIVIVITHDQNPEILEEFDHVITL